jgi:hypothetical protein
MKRTIRQLMLPMALVVLALLVPAQAANASALDVLRDCGDSDSFERKHSRADLNEALRNPQADLAEYGTCEQMIRAALAALASKRSGGDGQDAAAAADIDGDGVISPEERAAAAKKAKQKRKQADDKVAAVSDELIQDDAAAASGGDDGGSGGGSLPLILALVALVCAGVGGGLWYASKRNPGLANALRRVSPSSRNS